MKMKEKKKINYYYYLILFFVELILHNKTGIDI